MADVHVPSIANYKFVNILQGKHNSEAYPKYMQFILT